MALPIGSPHAFAQPDPAECTEAQLRDNYHRSVYREEFNRRLATYTKEERDAAMAQLRDPSIKRRFPADYTDDELIACSRDLSSDPNPAHRALEELKKRYETATIAEMTDLANQLRAEYQATPYPQLKPDMSNSAEFSANHTVYADLDRIARACLTERTGLALFREVYLDSGQPGAATRFLMALEGGPFQGPATQTVLEELATRFANYDRDKLAAMGESEDLEGVIFMAKRRFTDNSFEALKAREWQRSSLDISAMGHCDNPEARELLLAHYATVSKEWLATETRLHVLRALVDSGHRNPDSELRRLLRAELTEILDTNHSDNLHYLARTAEVIGLTGDPYYVPLLQKQRATLNISTLRDASSYPEDITENDVNAVLKSLDKALEALEGPRQTE